MTQPSLPLPPAGAAVAGVAMGGARAGAAHHGTPAALPLGRRPTVFIAHPSDMLTDHLPNGDGLVAYGFIHELAARGYRLHIATRETALRRPLPENATLYPIKRRFSNLALNRLHYMLAIRRLLRRLRKAEQIDLVHQLNPVFIGLSLGLIGCGLPIVLGTFVARWPGGEVDAAGHGLLSRSWRAAARWALNLAQQAHATALLVTTPAALNRIAVPALVRSKIVTMRHGIDTALFSPATPAAPRGVEVPSILFYAHLDRRKGVFVLLEAFQEVLRALPTCRLVLAGGGMDTAEVRRVIAEAGFGQQVELLGPYPRGDAPALMRKHDVYCLPSFGEPYGMTALEAMSCGRPVVVTDAGGLRDVVPEGGGLRVPQGDPAALAAALLTILRAPALQQSMGATNRAYIERHHTWQRVVDDLEAVYARLLLPRAAHAGVPAPTP